MSTDAIRKSLRVLVDEIVTAHDALNLPVDHAELDEARAIIARIEARLRSMQPLPQPDPTKVADFGPAPRSK